jgi:hypothetical protein
MLPLAPAPDKPTDGPMGRPAGRGRVDTTDEHARTHMSIHGKHSFAFGAHLHARARTLYWWYALAHAFFPQAPVPFAVLAFSPLLARLVFCPSAIGPTCATLTTRLNLGQPNMCMYTYGDDKNKHKDISEAND